MLLLLCVCWTARYTIYAAGWAESISFFLLTFILLNKFAKPNTYGIPIVLSIILGRTILEIPVRLFDFYGSLFSLFVLAISVISILLGANYYRERRIVDLVFSAIIMILLNTVAHHAWFDYTHFTRL